MIDIIDDQTIIAIEEYDYEASHSNSHVCGPDKIIFGNDEIIRDVTTTFGDIPDNLAIQDKPKAFRKGQEYTICRSGTLPYGNPIAFNHTFRYRKNYMRATSDISIPAQTQLPRHLELASLTLPGKWQRLFISPAAQHQAEGAVSRWQKLPTWKGQDIMVGHWHRPPVSLIFERRNGTQVEVGTGSDLWRWEKAFQNEPEAASYKIYLREDGLRLVREPHMSCFPEKTELSRSYRFSWYLAWSKGEKRTLPKHQLQDLTLDKKGKVNIKALRASIDYLREQKHDIPVFVHIDLEKLRLPQSACKKTSQFDLFTGESDTKPCFAGSAPVNLIKKIVRSLCDQSDIGGLIFSGIEPKVCHDSSHTSQKNTTNSLHWDINETLDCFQWVSQQCNELFPVFINHDDRTVTPILEGLES